MAFKMKKSPIMRKVKDFTSPIDMRSPVKNDERERLETYMTDTEKRLLEIKRQRALLNKEEEFKEDKETKPTVGTLNIKDGEVIGGGPDGGLGDLYKMMKKVITLDFGDQEPVNR